MALKSEQELGKLAVVEGIFNKTKLAAMLEASSPEAQLGHQMLSESLLQPAQLKVLLGSLARRNVYTATWLFGRHLVSQGFVSREELKSCMGQIKQGLKDGSDKPQTLLDSLVEQGQLDAELRESLDPQLAAFVQSFSQIAAYGAEQTPGLETNEQFLRSAYQREMLDDKQLYAGLVKLIASPVEDIQKMMRAAGLLTAEQVSQITGVKTRQRPKTGRKTRPTTRRTKTDVKARSRRREASAEREQPAKKQGMNAKLGIGIGLAAIALLVGLGMMFSGKQKPAETNKEEQVAARPKPKQSRAKPKPRPRRDPKPELRKNKRLLRARAAALLVINEGKLARSVDALETFKEALLSDGGGRDWDGVRTELIARIRTQGEKVFRPKKAKIESLIAQQKFKAADAILQDLWGSLPPEFADALERLSQSLAKAMEAAAPKPKPTPKPTPGPTPKPKPGPARALSLDEQFQQGAKLHQQEKWVEALQLLSPVSKAQPANFRSHFLKAACHYNLDNQLEALRWIDQAIAQAELWRKKGTEIPNIARSQLRMLRGQILASMSETQQAIEAYTEANKLEPLKGAEMLKLPDLLWTAGRFAEALTRYDALVAAAGRQAAWPHLGRGYCLMNLGQFAQAQAAFDTASSCDDNKDQTMARVTKSHHAWLQLTGAAAEQKGFSVLQARKILLTLSPFKTSYEYLVYALLLVAEQLYSDAVEFFEYIDRGIYQSIPELPFNHGLALLQLGELAGAREKFGEALRRRPRMKAAMLRLPGISQIAGDVLRDIADVTGDLLARVTAHEDQWLLRRALTRVDALLGANEFAAAIEGYQAFGPMIQAASLKAELLRRTERAGGLAALRALFCSRVGKLKSPKLRWQGKAQPVKGADATGVTLAAGTTIAWSRIGFPELRALFEQLKLTPTDHYLLGSLAWHLGRRTEAHGLLIRARKSRKVRPLVDRFLADMRGIDPPKSGFLTHRGRLVTSADRKALNAGKRRYNGRWVSKATLKKLQAGQRRIDGKWIAQDPTRLEAQGFAQHKGKWLTERSLRETPGWKAERTLQTRHFLIKTDRGKLFMAKLALVLEKLHEKLEGVFRKRKLDKRLTVLAYSRQRDYLAYLSRFDSPAHRTAARRAAMVSSEPRTLAIYDRDSTSIAFLRRVIGEVVELYLRLALDATPPDWALRGFKTHFMGFVLLDAQIDWSAMLTQPSCMARRANARKMRFSLEQLTRTGRDKLTSPRQAAVFEAQAWALFHLFQRAADPALRQAFVNWIGARNDGGKQTLQAHLGPERWKQLRQTYDQFVEDL